MVDHIQMNIIHNIAVNINVRPRQSVTSIYLQELS